MLPGLPGGISKADATRTANHVFGGRCEISRVLVRAGVGEQEHSRSRCGKNPTASRFFDSGRSYTLRPEPDEGRDLIPKRGDEIRSLRHVGHRPGRVKRARSRKIKPQCRHSAISRTNRRVLSRVRLRAIWFKWSSASRSGIA